MNREPGGDQGRDNYEKTNVAEAAVQVFEVLDLRLAGLLALLVLLGRGGGEGRHRGIIAYVDLADRGLGRTRRCCAAPIRRGSAWGLEGGEQAFADKDNMVPHGKPRLFPGLFFQCLIDLHVRDRRGGRRELIGLGAAE